MGYYDVTGDGQPDVAIVEKKADIDKIPEEDKQKYKLTVYALEGNTIGLTEGTKGYIYVPAPWWKTDYFEVRYEKPEDNQRFFYQLDGEGIRYEIVTFAKSIEAQRDLNYVETNISKSISEIIESFNSRRDLIEIK